jgi:hypothetical protein
MAIATAAMASNSARRFMGLPFGRLKASARKVDLPEL